MLLTGPSGAGKTCLLYQLATGKFTQTITSMDKIEAEVSFKTGNTTERPEDARLVSFQAIDMPGHGHFEDSMLDAADAAQAILLVLDAKDRAKYGEAAEFLFSLLNKHSVIEDETPIVIVCNKQDL